MSIKEAISQGYSLANRCPGLIKILLIINTLLTLVSLLTPIPEQGAEPAPVSLMLIAEGVLFVLAAIFIEGGSIAYINQIVQNGAAALSDFMAGGKKNYVKLLLLDLTLWLTISLGVLVIGMLFFVMTALVNPFAGIGAAAIAAPFVIYFFLLLMCISPYAIVIDEQKVGASIKTSRRIAKQKLSSFIVLALSMVALRNGVIFFLGKLLLLAYSGSNSRAILALLSVPITAYLGALFNAVFVQFYRAKTKGELSA